MRLMDDGTIICSLNNSLNKDIYCNDTNPILDNYIEILKKNGYESITKYYWALEYEITLEPNNLANDIEKISNLLNCPLRITPNNTHSPISFDIIIDDKYEIEHLKKIEEMRKLLHKIDKEE